MGQSTNQQQTVPGVRIDVSQLRGTTRFNDLHDDLQKQIKLFDDVIQQQIRLKNDCDAIMPAHNNQLAQVPHDVEFVRRKRIGVENAQDSDAQAISIVQKLIKVDAEHAKLSFKAIDNLKLPPQYHSTGVWSGNPAANDNRNQENGDADAQDIVSFFKYEKGDINPLPDIEYALGWGVSQTGRFLRHFLYQGFNEDESGRQVFDGVFDQVGGAGRGSFNHRFGQASRDALQHFNFLFPVDMFPFADTTLTDPLTGVTDGLLRRASDSDTVPKVFHLLTNSEYFNRAGSLIHTDPTGVRDVAPPDTSRIYMVASGPHIVGRFPPAQNPSTSFLGQAPMNPLIYAAVVRALFDALDAWVVGDQAPPPSRYPQLSDKTLTPPAETGWPEGTGARLPQSPLAALRLDFGPDWSLGIVSNEPPLIGDPFVQLVPAVDENGNDRAGIRLPEIEVPLATQTGWNYRHASIGAADRLSSEIGSYFPFAQTASERRQNNDARLSIAERYRDKNDYLGRITEAALALVEERYLLAADLPEVIQRAGNHYDWAIAETTTRR